MSVIPHMAVCHSTQACAAETSRDRDSCPIEEGRKKALGKTSLSCLPSLPHQVRMYVGNTKPGTDARTHTSRPAVIVQEQRDIQWRLRCSWEQPQNGDGMISESSTNTSMSWHISTQKRLMMNILTVFRLTSNVRCTSSAGDRPRLFLVSPTERP